MESLRIDTNRRRLTAALAVLLAALVLAFLLVGCGGEEPTAQVIIVSATFTAQPQVVVVTATFTPLACWTKPWKSLTLSPVIYSLT